LLTISAVRRAPLTRYRAARRGAHLPEPDPKPAPLSDADAIRHRLDEIETNAGTLKARVDELAPRVAKCERHTHHQGRGPE
jgi:hypothetical protein